MRPHSPQRAPGGATPTSSTVRPLLRRRLCANLKLRLWPRLDERRGSGQAFDRVQPARPAAQSLNVAPALLQPLTAWLLPLGGSLMTGQDPLQGTSAFSCHANPRAMVFE